MHKRYVGLQARRVDRVAALVAVGAVDDHIAARWDHGYALEGKTVAVIGTGASAVQIVPTIAPKVGRMHVFQRTAAWVSPKMDRPLSEREHRIFRRMPSVQKLERGII